MVSASPECHDKNCVFHGNLRTRGAVRRGFVVSAKAKYTAVIEIPFVTPARKYERFEKKKSKIHVHVPPCQTVKEGDFIEVGECRKISKTKSHVFLKKIKA